MKKIVLLQTSGNELANQLWNYASVYAYSLEKDFELENPSFFEYGNYFTMPAPNAFFKYFFFLPFTHYTKRKTALIRRIWRKFYFSYARTVLYLNKKNAIIYNSKDNEPYYLAPTTESQGILAKLEGAENSIYFDSWLFRNPVGLRKFEKEIKEYFVPRTDIQEEVQKIHQNLRSKYEKIVGIHIRQGDYREWRDGIYFIDQERVKKIIEEYINIFQIDKNKTCFLITSDGSIDKNVFTGINTYISKSNAVTDLFLLSACDTIIGSNSTFGAFASYYGNIPFIVMKNEHIDWGYYLNRKEYFENKYSTMVHF